MIQIYNNNPRNNSSRYKYQPIYPSSNTFCLFPLSSEGMSPLGLAVQQPDPYMAGCAAPAVDCPSNTSRAALGQEDHACCPFDLASSSCCSTQQHFVPLSLYRTLSCSTKTLNPMQKCREREEKRENCGGYRGGEIKKTLPTFFLPTTSTSSDNGSGGFSWPGHSFQASPS